MAFGGAMGGTRRLSTWRPIRTLPGGRVNGSPLGDDGRDQIGGSDVEGGIPGWAAWRGGGTAREGHDLGGRSFLDDDVRTGRGGEVDGVLGGGDDERNRGARRSEGVGDGSDLV